MNERGQNKIGKNRKSDFRISGRAKKSAFMTVSYFDLFDYPLQSRQVHKYLFNTKSHLKETNQALFELKKQKVIESKGGYWFLAERKELVKKRQQNEKVSKILRRRLFWFGWLFKITPFVRSVVICNNLAFNNASFSSDIDLLILTKKNHLWIARFFSTLMTNLLGFRVLKKKDNFGQICLSFYLSEKGLSLESIDRDFPLFRSFWIALLDPIYDNGLFDRLLSQNSWALDFFPNLTKSWPKGPKKPLSMVAFLAEKFLDFFFPTADKFFFSWQKKKIKKPQQFAGEVMIKKSIFKSHFNNNRRLVNQKLVSLTKKLNLDLPFF